LTRRIPLTYLDPRHHKELFATAVRLQHKYAVVNMADVDDPISYRSGCRRYVNATFALGGPLKEATARYADAVARTIDLDHLGRTGNAAMLLAHLWVQIDHVDLDVAHQLYSYLERYGRADARPAVALGLVAGIISREEVTLRIAKNADLAWRQRMLAPREDAVRAMALKVEGRLRVADAQQGSSCIRVLGSLTWMRADAWLRRSLDGECIVPKKYNAIFYGFT